MQEKKKKVRKGEESVGFEMGLGAFGGFIKGLGKLIDLADKVSEEGGEIGGRGELKGLGKDASGVYGFSIRTLAGRPVIESFGNIKETSRGPVVEEVREPLVDIFDERDYLRIVAEMPGVEETAVHFELKGKSLEISAEGRDRRYRKQVNLPFPVEASTMTSVYKNGIIEIRINKVAVR